jgi:hypothetical protein
MGHRHLRREPKRNKCGINVATTRGCNGVVLAALFMQPRPEAAVLRVDILDFHGESGADVFPERTTRRGPRTEAAGLRSTTRPVTSQSKRWRIAARFCLAVGGRGRGLAALKLDPRGHMQRLDLGQGLGFHTERETRRPPARTRVGLRLALICRRNRSGALVLHILPSDFHTAWRSAGSKRCRP